jgi:hypothetical protein
MQQSKRTRTPHHLNIFKRMFLFKSENVNKEAHLLQDEDGQKQTKRCHVREDWDKLVQFGLN